METDTEFTIKLTIPEISRFNSKIKSKPYIVAGISWNISVEIKESFPNDKYLSVSFDCNSKNESPDWSCIVDVTFRYLSSIGNHRCCNKPRIKCDNTYKNKDCLVIMFWDTLMWPGYGFVSNNCVTIEATFNVSKIENVRSFPCFDIQNNLTDMTLLLNGRNLHVNKAILSLYSPVFHSMFSSNFKEKEAKEVTLDDEFDEFSELLRVIYPCSKPVNKENVEYLLKLADKYDMMSVIDKCEEFLIIDKDVAKIKKLILAEKYSLVELNNRVVQSFKNRYEIKLLQISCDYNLLSDSTKTELMERMV